MKLPRRLLAAGRQGEARSARRVGRNARPMVFGVARLIHCVRRFITPNPGDVLTTGTRAGVAMGARNAAGQSAPRHLKPGDSMLLGIDGLRQQRQRVVPFHDRARPNLG